MSESETETEEAEAKALEEIGIPRNLQEGIKALVTNSSNSMERYEVAARPNPFSPNAEKKNNMALS